MLLVDTGPLVAAADRSDRDHRACQQLLEDEPEPLVTTGLVIAEAGYLIRRQLGAQAEVALYRSIIDGELRVEELTDTDWARVHELVATYTSLPLGGTDASLVALAERHNVTTIATLNHRDFRVVRPRHVDAFTLLP